MVIPTGCAELDAVLGGGLPNGLTLILGEPKVGKSMLLSSLAAEVWYSGTAVFFATAEMSELQQQQRVVSNLTGLDYEGASPTQRIEAKARFAQLAARGGLLRVCHFSSGTPVRGVLEWLQQAPIADGRASDLLLVDALDFLSSGLTGARTDVAEQTLVAHRLKRHAQQAGVCLVATAPAPSLKVWDTRHLLAEADQVIVVHKDLAEPVRASFEVLRSKAVASACVVGPLLTDRALGRMWPVNREVPW